MLGISCSCVGSTLSLAGNFMTISGRSKWKGHFRRKKGSKPYWVGCNSGSTVGTKIIADPEKCFQELISEKFLILLRDWPSLELIIVSSNFQALLLLQEKLLESVWKRLIPVKRPWQLLDPPFSELIQYSRPDNYYITWIFFVPGLLIELHYICSVCLN